MLLKLSNKINGVDQWSNPISLRGQNLVNYSAIGITKIVSTNNQLHEIGL